MTTASEIHAYLLELQAERALASIELPVPGSTYMAELEGEIAATTHAYIGIAVAEIATLRADLSGAQVG